MNKQYYNYVKNKNHRIYGMQKRSEVGVDLQSSENRERNSDVVHIIVFGRMRWYADVTLL